VSLSVLGFRRLGAVKDSILKLNKLFNFILSSLLIKPLLDSVASV
jgi:hypothetical protein